jgi:hypothetical protein
VLARRTAAEIPPRNQHATALKPRVVERVPRVLLAIILESVLAQTVERHAPEIPRRDDAIRINVIQQQRHRRPGDHFDLLHGDVVAFK